MVDPQPVGLARPHPAQDEPVGAGEHAFVLDVQPDQARDVEEATVVEVARRRPPVREPVVLLLEERIQQVGRGVDLRDRVAQRGGHLRILRERTAQELEEHALVTAAAFEHFALGRRRRQEALKEIGKERSAASDPHRSAVRRSSRRPNAGRPGRHGRSSTTRKAHPSFDEADLAALEHAAVVIAKDRHEDLVQHALLGRVPLDVEVAGERARRAAFEHIPPPRVRCPGDAHVVGDDVEHLPETAGVQGRDQPAVSVHAAELRVHAAVVHHVVAVQAAGCGLEIGRGVQVADPELGQVVDHPGCVGEGEPGGELQAVGGARGVRHPGTPAGAPRASGLRQSPSGRRRPAPRRPRSRRRRCPGCAASRSSGHPAA